MNNIREGYHTSIQDHSDLIELIVGTIAKTKDCELHILHLKERK